MRPGPAEAGEARSNRAGPRFRTNGLGLSGPRQAVPQRIDVLQEKAVQWNNHASICPSIDRFDIDTIYRIVLSN